MVTLEALSIGMNYSALRTARILFMMDIEY